MSVDDIGEIHVEDDVRGTHDHIGLRGTLEQHLVRVDVAQKEANALLCGAVGAALQQEQAALLAIELPLSTASKVVDEAAVVAGQHDAHGADARVHHVGEREVDKTIAAHERDGCERAALEQGAVLLACIVGSDIADGLTVDHRIIPPFR